MKKSIQELNIQKNYFYRDSYRRILIYITLLMLLGIILALILAYLTWEKKVPEYYASTTSGEVIQLHALSEPVVSNSHLLEWAEMVARKSYSLSFLNYEQQLAQAQPYFTSDAWNKFINQLNTSGVLKTIKNEKLIMETIVTASPNIIFSGELGGRFRWRIQLPVLVTYTSASQQRQSKEEITMEVARVPVLDTPEGIQVTSFLVAPGG